VPLSWSTVVWSMLAGTCLTLAALHLLVWCRQRTAWGSLLFSLSAAATAAMAGCELWMMRAGTTAEFGLALRWLHAPAWVLVLALVGFVRVHLRAGRPWLAWMVCGVRTLSLVLDFLFTPNLNYREITGLERVPFLGESVSVAVGPANPWMLVGQASLVLWVLFVVDATVVVWRRGEQRQAILVGFSIVFFVALGSAQAILALWGIVHAPVTASLFYMGIIASMGYDLSDDVLQAARLAKDLRASEERFRLAVEALPNATVMVDSRGAIVLVNAQAEAVFGYTRAELVGQSIERLVPERHRVLHPGNRQAYTAEPITRAMGVGRELCGRRKDGSEVPVEIGLNPIRLSDELFVLASIVDITERKRAEREGLRQRSELAHLSRVTMLGELSGSMAHELNQPLTAILSNAQAAQRFLAREPVDLDEVRDILADIVEQDNRAGEIIRRLRMLLRKGEVQQQPLALNELVREVLALIQSDLVNQGVTARTELAPALPSVNGDRVQLQQVLLNLVMNACDAMNGSGPAERQLVVRTELADGELVRVSVSDRGTGIAAQSLERVFEPFFTTKPQGLGLGLSVCRSIITAHGGKLWAMNNQERGATFCFHLPVHRGGRA